MSEYSPKPKSLGGIVKVELDLSNYARKADLKMQQRLIYYNLLKNLIELNSNADKLDIDLPINLINF